MQGCPLRCAYCHNPETWVPQSGEEATVAELASKIERYRPYILKHGGVTISGGEPLLQHEFVAELLQILKETGYHTALDTSGIGTLQGAEKILQYTDLAIVDLKFTDMETFQTYCHGNLQQVYDFLDLTTRLKTPLWIRQVIVPGLNDTKEDITQLKRAASRYPNLEKLELLPFRKLCEHKYEELGIPFPLIDAPECSPYHINALQEYLDQLVID
jgi:pyruvate formate lyase activating enzyme